MLRRCLALLLLVFAVPLAAAPLGQWDAADVAAGRLPDGSGHGLDGRLVGAQPGDVGGRAVLTFAGNEGGVLVDQPVGAGAEAFTALAHVHLGRLTGEYQGLIGRDRFGGSAGDAWALLLAPDNTWSARITTAAGNAAVTAPAQPGWHQVAMVYDGRALRLFVDGQPAGERPLSGAMAAEPDTPLALGSYASGPGPFSGALATAELRDDALEAGALAERWQAFLAALPPIDSFTFAQASDLHVTDTRSLEILNDAVDRINADPGIAFTLWLGDLTRASTPDEMVLARLALDRLAQPRWVVPGNHDQTPGVFEAQFGATMHSFTYGGWQFLLVNSNPGDDVPLAPERIDWLREQLARIDPATPIVLAMHHPLGPGKYQLAGHDALLALFANHNLKAVLGGHFHANREQRIDGVLFTTTAPLTTTRENHDGSTVTGYRLFHVRDGEIETEFVEMRDLAG